MQTLNLFETKYEWLIFFALCLCVFGVNTYTRYAHFEQMTARKFYDVNATVISQNQKTNKNNKPYWVLQLESDQHGKFYTTTFERLKPIEDKKVRLVIITDNISFVDYLRGFYAPSIRISLFATDHTANGGNLYKKAVAFFASQHTAQYMKELFPALYLASPQSKELRVAVTKYAAAHLIALSGFHLAIVTFMLGIFIGLPYRFLQARYFVWRNGFFDISIITVAALLFYLIFTGVVPSLLRAFVMLIFGMLLAIRHISIISFQTLLITSMIIIAFNPSIIMSIGFLLSVSGVFYIFLYLHYFRDRPKIETVIGLSVYVYFAMLIIVHYFFPLTAFTQLLSPILTLIYSPFFIIALLLHIIGYGGVLDSALLAGINYEITFWNVSPPLWLLISYICLSIAAIFHRYIHYIFIAAISAWGAYQYLYIPFVL